MTDIQIIPYVKRSDGVWTLPNIVLDFMWVQMVADKTVKTVFNEGEVTSKDEFRSFMQSPANIMFTIWTDKPCAIAWLNQINRGAYWVNFCILSFSWGKMAVKIGHKMINYWYGLKMENGEPMINSLAGMTPESNKPALRYISKVGGKIIGTVPGIVYDVYENKHVGGIISHIGRQDNG